MTQDEREAVCQQAFDAVHDVLTEMTDLAQDDKDLLAEAAVFALNRELEANYGEQQEET